MIDSGLPVTIFTTKDLKKILAINLFFERPPPPSDIYLHFIQRPLDVAGFIHRHLKVAKQELKRARTLVTAKSRSLVGRNWLAALKYQFTPANHITASKCSSKVTMKITIAENSCEVVESAFRRNFRRHGRIKDHVIELEFFEILKFTQQKGRRIPIQLQEAVQNEIVRLMNEKHIENMSTVNDMVVIQSTVIIV